MTSHRHTGPSRGRRTGPLAGLRGLLASAAPSVGGQAVMEGVMMRNRDRLAIAVRKPDGTICVELRPWFSLTSRPWLKKPFVRGFPVLIETLVNGIKALNYSAQAAAEDEDGQSELKPWHLVLTVAVAIALALGLFVVLPHLFSLGVQSLGWGGGTEDLSFHAWDGLFKLVLFLGYIAGISLMPDIKRVFQYHGAEHKVIWAFEAGRDLDPSTARGFSRLHPRCGTAFLLFVLCLSILLHAVLIPGLLTLWTPPGVVVKHACVLVAKMLVMIPVASVAFEMIKYAGRAQGSTVCTLLCWPGLMLQYLTTFEPDDEQLEVAIAALRGATE